MTIREIKFMVRVTEEEDIEIKQLLKSIKAKSGKKASEALIVSLRLFNNILDGKLGDDFNGKD